VTHEGNIFDAPENQLIEVHAQMETLNSGRGWGNDQPVNAPVHPLERYLEDPKMQPHIKELEALPNKISQQFKHLTPYNNS
jgi:hypothetical protein